jgi:hypothetical protein
MACRGTERVSVLFPEFTVLVARDQPVKAVRIDVRHFEGPFACQHFKQDHAACEYVFLSRSGRVGVVGFNALGGQVPRHAFVLTRLPGDENMREPILVSYTTGTDISKKKISLNLKISILKNQ